MAGLVTMLSGQAQRLISPAIPVSGPPVSSDIRFQLLDFQSITLDLHLVKSDLRAMHGCCDPTSNGLIQLHLLVHHGPPRHPLSCGLQRSEARKPDGKTLYACDKLSGFITGLGADQAQQIAGPKSKLSPCEKK
jgi:hypothetical protein